MSDVRRIPATQRALQKFRTPSAAWRSLMRCEAKSCSVTHSKTAVLVRTPEGTGIFNAREWNALMREVGIDG